MLFGDLDLNYTKARAVGAVKGEDYIPLAPSFASIGGISAKMKNGFSGAFRYRFMDHRPANEFNSVRAEGYFISDITFAYAWEKI